MQGACRLDEHYQPGQSSKLGKEVPRTEDEDTNIACVEDRKDKTQMQAVLV